MSSFCIYSCIARTILFAFTIDLAFISFAEARTIASGMFFQGDYQDRHIYGTLNSWDNRACTVIDNKVVLGRVSDDLKKMKLLGASVRNLEAMPYNPHSSSQIPTDLLNSSKFEECIKKTMYAKCAVRAGVKYYKTDDKEFRGVIKNRAYVFSMGIENNSYARDEQVDNWALLSFKPNSSENFIIDKQKLNCKSR